MTLCDPKNKTQCPQLDIQDLPSLAQVLSPSPAFLLNSISRVLDTLCTLWVSMALLMFPQNILSLLLLPPHTLVFVFVFCLEEVAHPPHFNSGTTVTESPPEMTTKTVYSPLKVFIPGGRDYTQVFRDPRVTPGGI